jgi:uncharacterized protein (DUF2147 family)
MRPTRRILLLGALCVLSTTLLGLPAEAAPPPPVGYWTTIDDDGKTKKAVVLIESEGDTLSGRVVHIFDATKRNNRCTKCQGEQRDAPMVGLRFMWNLRRDGNEWSGGSVLDPTSGKMYRCFIEPIDGGKRLKVRGYLGISLLGRTQYWIKASGPTG